MQWECASNKAGKHRTWNRGQLKTLYLPCSFTISLTPWKNPLNLGFLDVWSLMNLTLIVSIGVTARIASLTPAPKPQNKLPVLLRLPLCLSLHWFLKYSLAPNLFKKTKEITVDEEHLVKWKKPNINLLHFIHKMVLCPLLKEQFCGWICVVLSPSYPRIKVRATLKANISPIIKILWAPEVLTRSVRQDRNTKHL